MRFCSRCGFAMEGVMHLLGHNGMLPRYPTDPGDTTISPRRKGVKQGVILMLLGVLFVPIFGVMAGFSGGPIADIFAFCAAITAIVCFIGGPLRMLFAGIFEEGAKPKSFMPAVSYLPPAMPPPPQARVSALPPPAVNTQPWRARPDTAEIMPPTSVPDHTTKLLEKTESEKH
ncbi:MAG TPA: hypothetical protein VFX97_12565 [Pyrinomonadaceae bacterium]|nr:hypothetical protein [Pyrinomonadaceae bacterium]